MFSGCCKKDPKNNGRREIKTVALQGRGRFKYIFFYILFGGGGLLPKIDRETDRFADKVGYRNSYFKPEHLDTPCVIPIN